MWGNLPLLLELFDEVWAVISAIQIAEEAKKRETADLWKRIKQLEEEVRELRKQPPHS